MNPPGRSRNRVKNPAHPGHPKPPTKSQAAFVPKLFSILEEDAQGLISWSASGERFSVYNPIDFSRLILPQHFKHNNWQSFVRQLNMYGFHKCNDSTKSSSSPQAWEFSHPHFRKSRPDLIPLIKRRSTRPSVPLTPPRAKPYDPVRDPEGVAVTGPGREQIGDVLRMMLGLISSLSREASMGDKLEATRLAIARLEDGWGASEGSSMDNRVCSEEEEEEDDDDLEQESESSRDSRSA